MINCAFLVGCKEYEAIDIPNLEGIDNDILKIKNALINHCDCSEDNIFVIANVDGALSPPTSNQLLFSIIRKGEDYEPFEINNLFFYFSGHGFISSEEEPTLMPEDSLLRPLEHGTIHLTKIAELLRRSFKRVKHIIFILDMCQVIPSSKGDFTETKNIKTDYFPKGVIIFHSCFPKSSSYIIPPHLKNLGEGSVYTSVFIEALNSTQCYTVFEIDRFIKARIKHYNSEIGISQKPFTSLQDSSLNDVLIKHRDVESQEDASLTRQPQQTEESAIDDVCFCTIDDLDEYKRANTINVTLSESEICMVIEFAKGIDPCNTWSVMSFGEGTIRKTEDYYDKLYDLISSTGSNTVSLKAYKDAKTTIHLIYNKSQSPLAKLSKGFSKISNVASTDKLLNSHVDKISSQMDKDTIPFLKLIDSLDRYYEIGLNYNKELAMYYVSGNIAYNNTIYNGSALQTRLELLKNNYFTLTEKLNELRQIQGRCYDNQQKMRVFLRKTNDLKRHLYRNKSSTSYSGRYNSSSLKVLLEVITQIENYDWSILY